MEKHKQLLDKEYEQLLTQFSKELEKLQLKHQEELGKRLKMNINTEKKLIKEVSQVCLFDKRNVKLIITYYRATTQSGKHLRLK